MTSGKINSTISNGNALVYNPDQSMRARQLVATVRQGRQIRLDILDEGWVEGYLAGWDAETYFVLSPTPHGTIEKLLIPKANILMIQLVDERTFREEPLNSLMEPIVGPFRDAINNQYPKG